MSSLINQKYPHLLPPDVPVWERWLNQFGETFSSINYDVHVGDGRDPGPEFPEPLRLMGITLTQKRIDAVAHKNGVIWLIEITRVAGVKAIGQTICYPILYRHTFPTLAMIIPTIVCEELTTDIDKVVKAMDLQVFILPPETT